jgi:acetylornithine deacetylase/succinyl-diaminopimelate desuccinylase-like protein
MLSGSKQTNVIPNAATCNLDVRLLPGEAPEEFLKALTAVIADPSIKIENANRFKPPNSSPTKTDLFSLITRKTKRTIRRQWSQPRCSAVILKVSSIDSLA